MIKHTSIYLLLSFFLCQSAHGYDYKWKWVDSEFDSIANKLEEVDFMDLPHEAFRPEVMKLRQYEEKSCFIGKSCLLEFVVENG